MEAARRQRLVADGIEGLEGRALLLISALHIAAPRLATCDVTFVRAGDPVVATAVEALGWDTGIEAAIAPAGTEAAVLTGASLFVAVAFRDTAYLPLATVASLNVPILVALQFPDPARHGAQVIALQRAAHDPERLAAAIVARLEAP